LHLQQRPHCPSPPLPLHYCSSFLRRVGTKRDRAFAPAIPQACSRVHKTKRSGRSFTGLGLKSSVFPGNLEARQASSASA
jgi:hypothetical protein